MFSAIQLLPVNSHAEYCHEALSILNEKNLYKANVILTDKIPETEIEENSAVSVLNITNKMGIEELEKYSSFAKPLEENDLKKAKTLIEKVRFAEIMNYMLEKNQKLEQEIISWKEM